jgi:hypothetical protein
MRLLHATALLVLLLAVAARAQTPVDLQLVLAVDASGSVNNERFELQKHGYAEAFRSPSVLQAIQSGAGQAIAVTMVQWTGPSLHEQVLGWTLIHDAASAGAFADAIDATPRKLFRGGTSISGAIDYAMTLFPHSPYQGTRRVIDFSGDGANNSGRPAPDARDDALAQGVGINALPILTLEPDLDEFYRDNVIGGPGAFVIVVHSYDEFAAAILRKLVTEIAAADRARFAQAPRARSDAITNSTP